jgi:Ca2+-transporting ATPase
MSIAREDGAMYVKGAFEAVVPLCAGGTGGAADAHAAMAARGLRVLAVAGGHGIDEERLDLIGLIGLADPPRPEAIRAVAAARAAGIVTVMITGDHPVTARAIARELGILQEGSDASQVVHARATPEDKLRIVERWKRRGAVVAMTGDGVNDAPALRAAHIGIAMGRTGTEVTREAADMILTDDNFASIVEAVREGRIVFGNIQKAIVYLLAGNTGELGVMLAAALVGLPLPLLPLHLLWINVMTDGLPALALVMDRTTEDVLAEPPRSTDTPMLGRTQWIEILLTGLLQTACALGVFVWALDARGLDAARHLAFSALVCGELFRSFAARSRTQTFWEAGAFTNLRLLVVVLASVLVQVAVQRTWVGQLVFGATPLSWLDTGLALVVGLVPVTAIELHKLVTRRVSR